MIKQLANSDITVRPFTTYKNWDIQSIDAHATNSFGESTYFDGKIRISEGVSCSGIFYPTGSPFYNASVEPVNPNGDYKRIVYTVAQAMFYNNYNNPLLRFGVENFDIDPITGNKENRTIYNRILVSKIKNGLWGEKIKPGSVKLVDDSNLHERYTIVDDTNTNLRISGSQFPYIRNIRPQRDLESQSYWDTSSGRFYFGTTPISYGLATSMKDRGYKVTYVPSATSWKYDLTKARNYYQADNERFGYDVSAWYKYIAVGSPMDERSFSLAKQGHVQLFKYDVNALSHRFMKKFVSPFTQNALAQEIGTDNSLALLLEDNSYLYLNLDTGAPTSSLMDEFGHSVYVRDDFMVVGAPNGDSCVVTSSHAGFAYVYGKNKGGVDNWGLVSIIEGTDPNSRFGEAVCVDDQIVAIGAPGTNNGRGAVYLFRKKRYSDVANCETTSMPTFWNYVVNNGICERLISETGNEIVGEVVAPSFVKGDYTWTLEGVLTASVATTESYFGSDLEFHNGRLIVGCRKINGPGFAVLYTASYHSASFGACPTASWSEYKVLVGNNDAADLDPLSPFNGIEGQLPYNGFGRKVAIDGDHVAVCSYYDKSFVPFVGSDDIQTRGAVYFYTYGGVKCLNNDDVFVMSYDYDLRYKTFGDTSTIINNNFAQDVSVRGTKAIVSTSPDQMWYSASYNSISNTFSFENSAQEALNADDQRGTLGRVSFFEFDPNTLKWTRFKTMKRSKEANQPNYVYGHSVCLSDFASGSKFLVVGAPVFNYNTGSDYDCVIDKNYQRSGNFPSKYSGSIFVYDMDTMEQSPQIGNVFYKDGQIILTNTSSNYYPIMTRTGSKGFSLHYQGTHTIFEHEYLISVQPGEFNYSTNPTALVNYDVAFDVNQDGVFDLTDIDLILRYLNKQKFYTNLDEIDNGFILERDTLRDESWWNSDIVMTEAGDALLNEVISTVSQNTGSILTERVSNYIQSNLIDTLILDIDGNGRIDSRDGYLLLNYWTKSLTTDTISRFTDGDSTRVYYVDLKSYIEKYTGELNGYLVDPNFINYLPSSSYDPTGSYLSPCISSIGLYSDNQLVAVAKLGRPIKNLIDWPINFIVRFDT